MKILLADDDLQTSETLKASLLNHGFLIDVFPDSRSAMQAVSSHLYPLILLDIKLPAIDGLQLCRELRAHTNGKDSYIVLCTARRDSVIIESALAAGIDDYLLKPLNIDLLKTRMLAFESQARKRMEFRSALTAGENYLKDFQQTRDAARQLQNRIQLFSRITQEAAWDWNIANGTIWSNDGFHRLFGFSPTGAAETLEWWRENLHPEYENEIPPPLPVNAGRGHGTEYSYEYRLRVPDGSYVHVMDRRMAVFEGGKPARLIGTLTDISSHKDAVHALRESEQQLRQSQKMDAIGQLAGGVAHDFNNLLTIINGRTQLMVHRLPGNDPMRRELDLIYKTGERAAALTRQLLAFSRKQVLEPRILDLNLLVSDMEKMLRRIIREDIEIRIELESNLHHVKADPAQIEQVIMNLVLNARDAMPGSGVLKIKTSNATVAGGHAFMTEGTYAVLAVNDTGSGIAPEVKARLFEPFFTTKERGKGTGLGLSTVYGIVKQSGGYVEVETELGNGTTFKVYLPRTVETVQTAAGSGAMPAVMHGSEVILVVEDEIQVRELVCDVLEMYGYRVLVAQNGADALQLCQKHAGKIDLLMTDVVMPELGGPELANRLLDMHPRIKVMFMSGYTDHAVVLKGVLEAGMHFLQKPFPPSTLARKVREVLDLP